MICAIVARLVPPLWVLRPKSELLVGPFSGLRPILATWWDLVLRQACHAGCDISRLWLDLSILGPCDAVVAGARFAKDAVGRAALVCRLTQAGPDRSGVALLVIGASGGTGQGLLIAAWGSGQKVALVPARRMRQFARSPGQQARTARAARLQGMQGIGPASAATPSAWPRPPASSKPNPSSPDSANPSAPEANPTNAPSSPPCEKCSQLATQCPEMTRTSPQRNTGARRGVGMQNPPRTRIQPACAPISYTVPP